MLMHVKSVPHSCGAMHVDPFDLTLRQLKPPVSATAGGSTEATLLAALEGVGAATVLAGFPPSVVNTIGYPTVTIPPSGWGNERP